MSHFKKTPKPPFKMRKIFIGSIIIALFLSYTSSDAQNPPRKETPKTNQFIATVIAENSDTGIITVVTKQGAHVVEIDASGLAEVYGDLEKNVEYYFLNDIGAMDCDKCRVKTQVRSIAYHISPDQTAKNIAKIAREKTPQKIK